MYTVKDCILIIFELAHMNMITRKSRLFSQSQIHLWVSTTVRFEAWCYSHLNRFIGMSTSTGWFFFGFVCHCLLLRVVYISSLSLACLCMTWSLGIWSNSQNNQHRPKYDTYRIQHQQSGQWAIFRSRKKLFQPTQKKKKKVKVLCFTRKYVLTDLGSEERILCWLAWAIKGALSAAILFNAFSSCGGGSWGKQQ